MLSGHIFIVRLPGIVSQVIDSLFTPSACETGAETLRG
ncbi:hypothetical protein DAD186_09380 [Dermabacter vaginalis]|uniref:Uncharacterized protein n=1 Tax=Dermabacter vaginalis TaxID=1630135 RepID=A0A1B0ZHS1_9MICO|nr:hypothetical protein DAD186_09380 [Dermabacter vaginalis]